MGKPHELRTVRLTGHVDHPGEAKTDHAIHALDVICDPWDALPDPGAGKTETVGELLLALEPYPDPMHVRVAVPISHESLSHRMLDVVMLGHATGSKFSGVQLVCESWDNPTQVVKQIAQEEV